MLSKINIYLKQCPPTVIFYSRFPKLTLPPSTCSKDNAFEFSKGSYRYVVAMDEMGEITYL